MKKDSINKLVNNIKECNDNEKIQEAENNLSDDFNVIFTNSQFYELPLNKIFKIISKVIDKGVADIEIFGNNNPDLFSVLPNCRLSSFRFLVEQKEIDISSKKFHGLSVVDLANKYKREDICAYLRYTIEKPSFQSINDDDHEIHIAAENWDLGTVQYYIENENVPVDIRGFKEKTPLHIACENGDMKLIKYLIKKGANINAKNISGKTPIMLAAKWNRPEALKYLIQKGGNKYAKDNYKKTAFYYADNKNILEILKNMN